MTVAQMFVRATRHLNTKVPGSLSAENQQHLVDACNKALNQFTKLLPAMRVTEPRSERLPLPVTKTITATTGSATIAFVTPWAEVASHLGRTVIVAGDATRTNRLQSATTLLQAYEGTASPTTMEVLSDAVLLGQHREIAGPLLLVDGADSFPMLYGKPGGVQPGPWLLTNGGTEAAANAIVRARPSHWWVEPLNGITGTSTPSFVLRLWPMPDKLYQLKFNLRLWPTAFAVADISSEVVMPLETVEEAHFMDLVYPGLVTCPLWQGTSNKDDVVAAGSAALNFLSGEQPNQGHQQPARSGTKRGF